VGELCAHHPREQAAATVRRKHADDGQAGTRHLAAGDGQPEGVDPGGADDRAAVEGRAHAFERHDPPEPAGLLVGGLPAEVVPDHTQRDAELVLIANSADAVRHAAILSAAMSGAAMASL